MRTWKFLPVVVLALVAAPARPSAQSLQFGLFERYLDALRVQAGIPGLSAAIVADQQVVWEKGFGLQDVERSVSASPDTPYLIGDLTQIFGATLALQCVEEADVALTDPIRRWTSQIPEANATVRQILSHADASGAFHYEPSRFVALTPMITYCQNDQPYPTILVDRILDRLGMFNSVPGHDVAGSLSVRQLFDSGRLARYDSVLNNLAVPYRVDRSGRPTRSEYPARGLNAATGLISTVRDLAKFDAGLDDDALIGANMRAFAWSNGSGLPTGLGWFVQGYNGKRIVWHFGSIHDAFSSLIVKTPDLTLILLANSDGLSAPFPLSTGDVTASVFAQTFLRTFVP